jgi:hypothetical protein
MKSLKSVGRNVSLLSSTFALGAALATFLSTSSAQAATLRGVVTIQGDAILENGEELAPATDTLNFLNGTVSTPSTESFAGLVGTAATLSNLLLTQVNNQLYSATTTNPFITLADDIVFNVNQPLSVTRLALGGGFRFVLTNPNFTGTFVQNGTETLGAGVLVFNGINENGTYSVTITAVPEPTGVLGTVAALGIGAVVTNNIVKKKVKVTV